MTSTPQIREMCEEAGQNNLTQGNHLKNDCDYLAEVISNIRLSNMIVKEEQKDQSFDPSAILTTWGPQNISTSDLIPAVDDLDQGYT